MVWGVFTHRVATYLFHDHSPDGGRHPSILLCKLLAVTRATKLTLSNRTGLTGVRLWAVITLETQWWRR